MYWFQAGNPLSFFIWCMVMLTAWLGGWLIATHVFRLESHERLPIGLGLGLSGTLWLANVLGHWLDSGPAFIGGSLLTVAAGLGFGLQAARKEQRPLVEWRDWKAWPILLAILVLAGLFTAVGRGLAIYDEPKNLTIISRMAANDIPPHYYINSSYYFRYHYGFQLLGASLVRLGGMFPWSAFDLSKGIAFGLSVGLVGLVGKRVVGRWLSGSLTAAIFTLASGTRYLLLLVPQALLTRVDATVALIGTSTLMGVPFSQSLTQAWAIDGGPPVPFIFGFLNGIFSVLTIGHTGSYALSVALMALMLLLFPRIAQRAAWVVLGVLLAYWGLVWESSYGLFVLGGAAASFYLAWKKQHSLFSQESFALMLSVPLVLWQGGTITEIARQLLFQAVDSGIGVEGEVAATGFSLHWPPAVTSSHLGSLNIFSPIELLIALCELGPVIFLIPWISIWAWKRLRNNEWIYGTLILSAWIGLVVPLFLVYQAERDISRFTAYSMGVWTLFLIFMVLSNRNWSRKSLFYWAGILSLILMTFGGTVTTVIEMSTLFSPPVIGYELSGMDARIARDTWNRLAEGEEVFDAVGWRASALTGLPTRVAIGKTLLPEWEALQNAPSVEELLANGYRYVYVDDIWWRGLPGESAASLSEPCVKLLAEYWDAEGEHFRRLLDLQACSP